MITVLYMVFEKQKVINILEIPILLQSAGGFQSPCISLGIRCNFDLITDFPSDFAIVQNFEVGNCFCIIHARKRLEQTPAQVL